MNSVLRVLLLAILSCAFTLQVENLFGQCTADVPSFNVNLTGSPAGVWQSPQVTRVGNCCSTTHPDRCVKFVVTLDPGAEAIKFEVVSGALPGGALFYQVNCGPLTTVGVPLCLSGVGPHVVTFCKPGNNNNVYAITSIPAPTAPTSIAVNDGCTGTLTAAGFQPATVTWNSISPGLPGQYNNYLSCASGCLTTNVTAQPGYPTSVTYQI
nr:hypothetical protein [Bacteroidota bacterium]